jgi:hypothetical protein
MRAGRIIILASLLTGLSAVASRAAAPAIPDFSGYWVRPEAGNERMFYPPPSGPGPLVNTDATGTFTIGNHDSPILLPHAAAAVKANGDQGRAGNVIFPPWSLCWPTGVPLNLNMAEPVQFLQTRDQVTILYQRGMQLRRIDLDKPHPANPKPSWYGYSVGRYEGGNTLVVDTIAQDTRSMVDRFGTPKSDAFRIVERYTLSADKQRIEVAFTVTDPKTFTTTWSASIPYVRTSSRRGYDPMAPAFTEVICAENNKDAAGGFYPIPVDETPDF